MKKTNQIIKILITSIIILTIFLFFLTLLNSNKERKTNEETSRNKQINEIKETLKNNLNYLINKNQKKYTFRDLLSDNIITFNDKSCNIDDSNITITSSADKTTLEINLICKNSSNHIKEEIESYDYCEEISKQITEYEYYKIKTSTVFDHYECEEGYDLKGDTCYKKETKIEESTPIPNYEEIIIASMPAKEEIILNKTCPAGYSLEENICVTDSLTITSNKKSCSEGYYYDGVSCKKPVIVYSNYVLSCVKGELVSKKCRAKASVKEFTKIIKEIREEELSNKNYSYKYNAIDCHTENCIQQTFYVYENVETHTESYCKTGLLDGNYCIDEPLKNYEKKYNCNYSFSEIKSCTSNGFNQIGKLCETNPIEYKSDEKACQDGTLKDGKCINNPSIEEKKIYSCETGVLSNKNCEEKQVQITSYSCPDGFKQQDKKCIRETTNTLEKKPTKVNVVIEEKEYKWSSNKVEAGFTKTGNIRIK